MRGDTEDVLENVQVEDYRSRDSDRDGAGKHTIFFLQEYGDILYLLVSTSLPKGLYFGKRMGKGNV